MSNLPCLNHWCHYSRPKCSQSWQHFTFTLLKVQDYSWAANQWCLIPQEFLNFILLFLGQQPRPPPAIPFVLHRPLSPAILPIFPSTTNTLGHLPSHPPTTHTATFWFLSCWRMSWDSFGTQRMPTSWGASWQEHLWMENSRVYLLSSVRGTFDCLSLARR